MKNSHKMGGKLDIRWDGPYEVIEDCGKMRFQVKSVRNKLKKVLKKMVHCSWLKPYLLQNGIPLTRK